jgi:Cysteine-rich secretory protein family
MMFKWKRKLLFGALLTALCSSPLLALPLTEADSAALVQAHNEVRQRVSQAETVRLGGTVSIPAVTWDASLAATAQQWADLLINQAPPKMCHRCGDNPCDPPLIANQCVAGMGENLYMAWSTGTPDISGAAAVKSWADEEQYYNYDQNTCAPQQQCGHYTQIVWASTQRLGCGRAERLVDGRNYVIWACNYGPPGNITGQRPYNATPGGGTPGGGQAGASRHIVEVRFTKIRVHNCNEGGICAWRLQCGLGNQPLTMLLDNVEADDRDEPQIDRALRQDGMLPVNITCKLEERDAPIYEHLGTRTVTVAQGGDTTIRITHVDGDGDIDEGDVSIFMNVQTKILQPGTAEPPRPPLPPPAAPSPRPKDKLAKLSSVGIDFSVSETSIRDWLDNSFTPYPSFAAVLLRELQGKRLRKPVYIDVISWKYENAPGGSSPRSEAEVNLALLKAAIVRGHNERYGEDVRDFEQLIDSFMVLDQRANVVTTPTGARMFGLDGSRQRERP